MGKTRSYIQKATPILMGFILLLTIIALQPTASAVTFTVTVSPQYTTLDLGQSVTLTATVSGGTPSYKYQWYNDTTETAVLISNSTSNIYSTPVTSPMVTSLSYYVIATDSSATPLNMTSNHIQITVNPAPTVSISPTNTTLDPGQTSVLTAYASGGTGSYSYQWYNTTGTTQIQVGANNNTYNVTPTTPGLHTYDVIITETGILSGITPTITATSLPVTVTVKPPLGNPTISPQTSILNVGQSETLTATGSGGTGLYNYQWYLGTPSADNSILGAISSTYTLPTATATGILSYYVKVIDTGSGAPPIATSISLPATVTVKSLLGIPTIAPTSVTLDQGQSVTLTATASGGTPPYAYQWYTGTPSSGTIISNTNSNTFSPSVSTTTSYFVKVTNLGNVTTSLPATVTVNPNLTVSVSPPSTTLNVGQPVTLTATATGGTQLYSYKWYNGTSTTVISTSSTYTVIPNTIGAYTYHVTVTDSATTPTNTTATATVTVNSANTLTVSVSPPSTTLNVGQSVTLTATVSGGTPSYTYQWYTTSGVISNATSSTYTLTPSSTNTYYVKVTDSATIPATSQSNTTTITITANSILEVSISPSSATVDALPNSGEGTVLLTATASGGTPPYAYQWYTGTPSDSNQISGATSNKSFAYPLAITPYYGSTSYYVKVTDSATTATSNASIITVNPTPAVTIQPINTTLDAGQIVTYNIKVINGTGPFTVNLIGIITYSPGHTSSSFLSTGIINSQNENTILSFPTHQTVPNTYIVSVADIGANPHYSTSSTQNTIIINPTPTATLTANITIINMKPVVTLIAHLLNGTGPFTVQFYRGTSVANTVMNVSINSTATYTFTLNMTELDIYHVKVTDTGTTIPFIFSSNESLFNNRHTTTSISTSTIDTTTTVRFRHRKDMVINEGNAEFQLNLDNDTIQPVFLTNENTHMDIIPQHRINKTEKVNKINGTVNVNNVTNSSPTNKDYQKLLVMSIKMPKNTTINMTTHYNCSIPSIDVHVFKLVNNTWSEINSTANPTNCTVSYTLVSDPIVGIFSYVAPSTSTVVSTVLTTTAITTNPSTVSTTALTTLPTTISYSMNNRVKDNINVVIIAGIIAAIILIIALKLKDKNLKNKKLRSKNLKDKKSKHKRPKHKRPKHKRHK